MILIIAGSIILSMEIAFVILEIALVIFYYRVGHEPTFYEYMDVIVTVCLALLTIFIGVNMK